MNTLLRDTKFGFTKFSSCCAKGGGGGGTCTTTTTNNTTTFWEELVEGPECPEAEDVFPTTQSTLSASFPVLSALTGCIIEIDCNVEQYAEIISCELGEPELSDPYSDNESETENSGECSCGNSCSCTCNTDTDTETDVKDPEDVGGPTTKRCNATIKYKLKYRVTSESIATNPNGCAVPGNTSGSLVFCPVLCDFQNAFQPELTLIMPVEYTTQNKKQLIITVYTTTTSCG
jgi:hypothetical protein